jgi:hypothetical protein
MNGQDPGSITVYKKGFYSSSIKQQQLKISGNQGDNWQQAKIQLTYSLANYELSIDVTLGISNGNIAIDDIYLFSGDCSAIPTTPNPDTIFDCGDGNKIPSKLLCNFIKDCPNGMDEQVCADCNFENSTCQWIDKSDGSLKWRRNNASSSQNGPSLDHTLGNFNGHYMYVDSDKNVIFDSASLALNRMLQPCSSTCELEFYYHMFGSTEDLILSLIEEDFDVHTSYTDLIELEGDQGDQWNRVIIKLGRITKPFTFYFLGVRYFDGDYDLAIDDVRMKNCEYPIARPNGCPSGYFTCKSKGCISQNRVCDLIDDCGDGSDEENCINYNMCDFENGICDWKNDNNQDIDWIIDDASFASSSTGAKRDHTTGLSFGHFIHLDSFYFAEDDSKARLISQTYTVKPGMKCDFRAFYHMYGKDIGSLNIYLRTASGDKSLFQKSSEVGDYWERMDLNIKTTVPFQIVIEGDSKGYYGDISIDDTSFTDGCAKDNSVTVPTLITTQSTSTASQCGNNGFQCKSDSKCIELNQVCDFNKDCNDNSDEIDCGTCNFETSLCGINDVSSGNTKWGRNKAPSTNPTGPQVDHTTNLNNGYYLITEINDGDGFIDTAKLFGPRLGATALTCKMNIWVYMGGNVDSDMTIFFTNYSYEYDYERLMVISGPLGNYWKKYEIPIGKFPANYQLEIFGNPEFENYTSYSEIALDDIEFIYCSRNESMIDQTLECNFDNGFCSYYFDPTSDFKWERAYKTSTTNTGPSTDHTGKGYYAFIDTFYTQSFGDKARLISSIQTSSKEFCLIFWHHMFGEDIGTLNVYLDQHESNNLESNFNRTLIWTKSNSQGNRWIEARKTISINRPSKITFEGVVGKGYLGDISLDDIISYDGKCLPSKINDFELGFGDFQNVNDNTALLKWKIGQPTSVSIDHTTLTNQGSFAYVDFQSNILNSKGRLETPKFQFNGYECIQFWYLLNGKDNGNLNIYVKYINDYGLPIWSKNSHNNDEWRFGQITVGNNSNLVYNYSVIFEAVKGINNDGIAGIDDVNIKVGDCPAPINCNFEDFTICSWSQSKNDEIDWLLSQGNTDSFFSGPQVDNTLGTPEGVYLYLESSRPAKQGDKAILTSEYLQSTSSSCFSLWYFMYGKNVGELNIYFDNITLVPGLKLKNITGEQGFQWFQLQTDISSQSEFRIAIEAVVSIFYIYLVNFV